MPDMLVRLYDLPAVEPAMAQMAERKITIRRALPPERHVVIAWVKQHFGGAWASECEAAMSHLPTTCWLAIDEQQQLLGFACHEATCRGFFGPTGVAEPARGKGVGSALLLAALHDMRAMGYAYGIIGGTGPVEFYRKFCGATPIENSVPGIYRGMLKG